MERFPLEGKVTLITGGTEGIGAACAQTFAKRGARVIICGLPSRDGNPINAHRVLLGDVVARPVREEWVNTAIREFGRIDLLVNNAGVGLYAGAADTPIDVAKHMFEVNFFAALDMIQLVLPYLRKQGGGAIVNMSSVAGRVSLPWAAVYSATKHAVHALSESLRRELKREGIHVMTVMPGIVATRFRQHVLSGSPPPRVANTPFVISSAALAEAIANGIERRQHLVAKPWLCGPFDYINRWFPRIMDAYCAQKAGF